MPTRLQHPVLPAATVSVDEVFHRFQQLLRLQPFEPWRTRRRSLAYSRLWKPLIVLWYILWQRLQTDSTLDAVVKDARAGGADALCPASRPLSQRLRSRATTAFSDARRRLPLRWLRQAFAHFTGLLRPTTPDALWHGLQVGLLDGSTFRLRPYGNIPQRFAPAANQHGSAYWCLVRVVVVFCAHTGLALATTVAPETVSEQALAVSLLLRAGAGQLWIGDRNFGVWRLARAAVQAQSHVLVRLTQTRARALLGRGLRAGQEVAVRWTPTVHDQADGGLERQPVEGRGLVFALERPGFRTEWLYLFTTLTDAGLFPAAQLLARYGIRWHAELNLRYLKAQMRLDQLEVKSARLALQQWYAGLLAYNLIRGVMGWAGTLAGVSPLRLSFAQARRLVGQLAREWQRQPAARWRRERWERLLADVAAARQPKRRKPKPNEPRQKRHVRESFAPLRGSRQAARQQLLAPPAKS